MTLNQSVRTGQIITFALVQGLVVIAAVMAFLTLSEGPPGDAPANGEPAMGGGFVLPVIVAFLTVNATIAGIILPSFIRKAAANDYQGRSERADTVPDPEETPEFSVARLLQADQTGRIVGQAIFEGVGVVASVLMMIDGNVLYLGAVAVGIAGIAWQAPTVTKVSFWLESIIGESG